MVKDRVHPAGHPSLAARVLALAVKDFTSAESETRQIEALDWLLSDDAELWCDVVELDPEAFRDQVQRMVEERREARDARNKTAYDAVKAVGAR